MGKLKTIEDLDIYSMGKRFPVTGLFTSDDEANKYMESHKDEGVIAEIQGVIFVASFYESIKLNHKHKGINQ